jgi:two-component system, sensor histidine kinase and response regulator
MPRSPRKGESNGKQNKARILLVDDTPENLVALEAVLEPLNAELWKASSGVEALRHLLQKDFALILLDANMPGMSGFETAAMIRQREKTRHIPIIFVTAHHQEQKYVAQSYQLGAVDYIVKPYDPDILRSKVRVFVDLHNKNEQLKRQAELIHQSKLREAEQKQREATEALEREHIRALNATLESRVAERTAELLEVNEQLASFCYSVSHDLRAPLRAIIGTSRVLLEDSPDRFTDTECEMLQRQADAAKKMGLLIDDLLSWSRLSQREMRRVRVDVTRIAREVSKELLRLEWEGPITIEVEDGLEAVADPILVSVLLQNLIENACKYSPAGGTVKIGGKKEAGVDVFFVSDTGIGLDMNYASKIFEPFHRLVTETEYPGTGIGLANALRVVTRHGGQLWVESEVGKGATFFFTLQPSLVLPHRGLARSLTCEVEGEERTPADKPDASKPAPM